jgi:ketosteroid isomerase-like protein
MIRNLVIAVLSLSPMIAAAQNADTSATKAAIIAADRALAVETGRKGQDALLGALEPDAGVLIPGERILKGAAEARSPITARYASPSYYSWSPVHAIAGNDGKFGCTMGYSQFANARDSVTTAHPGVYLTCWRKAKNGQWRIAGMQRADTPGGVPAFADSTFLPGGPGSSAYSSGDQVTAPQDADSAFAMEGALAAGPGPAFARYAAADAMMLGGPEFPRGPDQIAAAFNGYSPERVITWRPRRDLGAGSGGVAYTAGNSISGPRPGKTSPSYYNKYMTVWRQNSDGRWLYVFDLGSPRPESR